MERIIHYEIKNWDTNDHLVHGIGDHLMGQRPHSQGLGRFGTRTRHENRGHLCGRKNCPILTTVSP